MRLGLNYIILLMLLVVPAFERSIAQSNDVGESGYDATQSAHRKNIPWVRERYNSDLKKFGGDKDKLVRFGMVASRDAQSLRVYADTAGMGRGDIVEYYLVGEKSSHDYEALAISFASPADVREGLMFIGLPPGKPVNYEKTRFWPKGKRVRVTVQGVGTNADFGPLDFSRLLWDYSEKRSILTNGFIFTGSLFVNAPDDTNCQVLAANAYDPYSIISDYNEPTTIMDIPYTSSKGDAYGDNLVNTNYIMPRGTLLALTMTPWYTNGFTRMLDLRLEVSPVASVGSSNSQDRVVFNLVDTKSGNTNVFASIKALLGEFARLKGQGHDLYVTTVFSPDLPLGLCHKVAEFYGKIDNDAGIRIEPPLPGQLFYKAFLPDEKLRVRANRYVQPLELHLKLVNGKADGTLIKVKERWGETDEPSITTEMLPVALHGGLLRAVADAKVDLPIMLVFASREVTYGQVMAYIRPILKTHHLVHIYLEPREVR